MKGDNMNRLEVVKVDAVLASKWLAGIAPNRPLNYAIVQRYADAMTNGEWMAVGDPIQFDKDERLINGQHRLSAVIVSETVQEFVVIWDVPIEAMTVMDTGRKRSFADMLHIRGEASANALASTVHNHWRFTRPGSFLANFKAYASYATLIEHLDAHPGLREATRIGDRIRRAFGGPSGIYATLVYEFKSVDEVDADGFVEGLISGEDLPSSSPLFRLRELMLDQRTVRGKRSGVARYPDWKTAALIVKAWNAWRDGQEMRQLVFRSGGAAPEQFPTIQ